MWETVNTFIKLWLGGVVALYFLQFYSLGGCRLTTEQGPFEIVIERQAATPLEEQLLQIAESICPDEAIFANCREQEPVTGGCRWWCGARNGIALAHAATGDAWRYYQDQITQLQQAAESHAITRESSARLVYEASIEKRTGTTPAGIDRYIVRIALEWRYYCGTAFCGNGFRVERHVELDANGNVIWLWGDGFPDSWIA